GFALDSIEPLLKREPGEVLINFMTSHIRRFIDSPNEMTEESFVRLFGSRHFKAKIQSLPKEKREEAAVEEYCRIVRRRGAFKYVYPAIILHPEIDRTHFHLIYLTRHIRGIEVFKSIEKNAMGFMESVRAEAQQRKRVRRSHQQELFEANALY